MIAARCRYRQTSRTYKDFSKAMELPEQRQRVTIDGLGNIGVGKRKNPSRPVAKSGGSGIIKSKSENEFHCYGDFLREYLGSAKDNHFEEFSKIREEVERLGGKLILLKDNTNMTCDVSLGNPGTIKVDENISIAGLKHEFRHFLDDMDNGNPGLAFYLMDNDRFFLYERRGYEEELMIARDLGLKDAEEKILNEIEKRRREIYGV